MGNYESLLCPWKQASLPTYNVLMLGLDGVGKTTFLRCLHSEETGECQPFVGVNKMQLRIDELNDAKLTVLDIDYSENTRPLWRQYYPGVSGIFFMVDSSDRVRMLEASQTLDTVLSDPVLVRVPLILLANKQDASKAVSAAEIAEIFNVTAFRMNGNPCRVLATVALTGEGVVDACLAMHTVCKEYLQLARQLEGSNKQLWLKESHCDTQSNVTLMNNSYNVMMA